jgi:hypothetical protein
VMRNGGSDFQELADEAFANLLKKRDSDCRTSQTLSVGVLKTFGANAMKGGPRPGACRW